MTIIFILVLIISVIHNFGWDLKASLLIFFLSNFTWDYQLPTSRISKLFIESKQAGENSPRTRLTDAEELKLKVFQNNYLKIAKLSISKAQSSILSNTRQRHTSWGSK